MSDAPLPDEKEILLQCPGCRKSQLVPRQQGDYPEAVRVMIVCGECDDGDFHEAAYFDANGIHITRDPEAA